MSLSGSAAHWKLSKENSWVRFSFFCFLCFSTLFWHAKCWNIISVFRAVFPLLGRISVNSFSCCLCGCLAKRTTKTRIQSVRISGALPCDGVCQSEKARGERQGVSAEFVVVVATWQIPYAVCATCCGVLTVLFTMLIEPSTGWQVK